MTNRSCIFAATRRLPVVCAVSLLSFGSLGSSGAQAADTEEITISAPRTKTIGHDAATGASIQVVMQSAHLKIDPLMFTTNSGIALVHDSVLDTARKICSSLDPLDSDDNDCVRGAVKSAQAQIDAAVARAKSTAQR
jgi:UrcA family protein